jgi:plastocyanin
MIRRIAAVALTTIPLALLLPAIPSSAGGGCHEGVTTGTGPTIHIVDACFGATITKVSPGEVVTFVNEDPIVHNVTANLWGHFDDLEPGDRFSVTFEDEGIYPFACTYHPGMSGAIVVGDGDGPGNGAIVVGDGDGPGNGAIVGSTPAGATPASDLANLDDASPVGATSEEASSVWPWVAGGAIGAVIGFVLAWVAVRRRSATPQEPSVS